MILCNISFIKEKNKKSTNANLLPRRPDPENHAISPLCRNLWRIPFHTFRNRCSSLVATPAASAPSRPAAIPFKTIQLSPFQPALSMGSIFSSRPATSSLAVMLGIADNWSLGSRNQRKPPQARPTASLCRSGAPEGSTLSSRRERTRRPDKTQPTWPPYPSLQGELRRFSAEGPQCSASRLMKTPSAFLP